MSRFREGRMRAVEYRCTLLSIEKSSLVHTQSRLYSILVLNPSCLVALFHIHTTRSASPFAQSINLSIYLLILIDYLPRKEKVLSSPSLPSIDGNSFEMRNIILPNNPFRLISPYLAFQLPASRFAHQEVAYSTSSAHVRRLID